MKNRNLPGVSIVIPVRNEEKYIKECLMSMYRQKYDKNKLEILIIDGLSSDATLKIINSIAEKKIKTRILVNPEKNTAISLNLGITEAIHKIIMRADARSSFENNYISKCVNAMEKSGADNVGGLIRPVWRNILQKAIGIGTTSIFGVGNSAFRTGCDSGFVKTVFPGFFRKTALNKVKGFRVVPGYFSEDSDINERIIKAGGKVFLDKNIEVFYYPRENIIELAKQYYRYGRIRISTSLKKGRVASLRYLVPPLALAGSVILLLLGIFINSAYLLVFSVAFFLYLACLVAFSAGLAIKNRHFPSFLLLIIVFPVIHISWASGFILGMFSWSKINYW